ncbi:MAG: SsrA-binding protein SmpB [Erysipelotrichaceae bacterium]|jgi:SsrA-binding protein|nr:SsrA-binding protein SmpB [Erysipelotrichaceae bacterium]
MATNIKVIANNRKAFHDYFIEEALEAGIELLGTEIKSVRRGSVQLRDSYVKFDKGEAYLVDASIAKYEFGNRFNHEEKRDRRLLLHKAQIRKLEQKIKLQGYTCVATKVYLSHGRCKVEIALAKGKHTYDKRQALKEKDARREIEKAGKYRR